MKIIVSSDWHLDWSTGGMPRLSDVIEAVQLVVGAAKLEGAELVLFLGDLTNPESVRSHRAVSVAVWVAMHLWACGIATRWVVGNHDVIEDGSGCSTLAALESLSLALPVSPTQPKSVAVYTTPTIEVFRGKSILALPFTSRATPYDPTEFIESLDPSVHVDLVIGHLHIEGIGPGSETVDMPRGRSMFLPIDLIRNRWSNARIFNGHYHQRQWFNGVHVPGSLVRLTFGEEHNSPGYLVVEV